MPLYENTFITRQDLSLHEVEKLTGAFTKIINDFGGKVVKSEQWGLRDLAYIIKKSSKGYYTFLGIDAPSEAVKEVERKMKLSEDVIRFATFRVESISENPSPLIAPEEVELELKIADEDSSEEA